MSSSTGRQEINCGVHSCKHNDKVAHCTLQDIVVGNERSSGDARSKGDTDCESFEAEM